MNLEDFWFLKEFIIITAGNMGESWDENWRMSLKSYDLPLITICPLLPDGKSRQAALTSDEKLNDYFDWDKVLIFVVNMKDNRSVDILEKYLHEFKAQSRLTIVISDSYNSQNDHYFSEADVVFTVSKDLLIRAIMDIVSSVSGYGTINNKISDIHSVLHRDIEEKYNKGIIYMTEINGDRYQDIIIPPELSKYNNIFINIIAPRSTDLKIFSDITEKIVGQDIRQESRVVTAYTSPPGWRGLTRISVYCKCKTEKKVDVIKPSHNIMKKSNSTADQIPSFLRWNDDAIRK